MDLLSKWEFNLDSSAVHDSLLNLLEIGMGDSREGHSAVRSAVSRARGAALGQIREALAS